MGEQGDGPETIVVVVCHDVEVTVGRVRSHHPNLALVDSLLRLQLAGRRLGWSIRLRHPRPEQYELLELIGLADARRVASTPSLEQPPADPSGLAPPDAGAGVG